MANVQIKSEKKKKKAFFLLYFTRFFSNFGFAEGTMHSEIKRKKRFFFCISLVFSTFAPAYNIIKV